MEPPEGDSVGSKYGGQGTCATRAAKGAASLLANLLSRSGANCTVSRDDAQPPGGSRNSATRCEQIGDLRSSGSGSV